MAQIPGLSWWEVFVLAILVLLFILIGFFWAGIILILVALVGYLLHKLSVQMAWLAGIIGILFVVISLIVGRF